ncbi:MAG: sensor histidine kinase [Cyclobacteriaceae bacterium]|nr:sensor histidine kinase [Cyclobacteriaceae bacterium]
MRKILTVILIVGNTILMAQTPMNLDSLLHLLPQAKEDTNKVLLLINIGQQYEGTSLESAAYYYLQCKTLADELDYTAGKIKFISNFTYVLNLKALLDSALQLNLESVALAREYGNRRMFSACLGNVASSYLYLEKPDSAVKYYLEAEKVIRDLRDPYLLLLLNQNLGSCYTDLKQYDKALTYLTTAVAYARDNNNPLLLSQALLNQGVVYNYLLQFDKAIEVLDESRRIAETNGDDFTLAHALLNMGHSYIVTGQFKKPKMNFSRALTLSKKLGIKELEAIALRGLGIYWFYQEQNDSAYYYARQALDLSTELKLLHEIGKTYQVLSDIAQQAHDYRGMNNYLNKEDSIEHLIQLQAVAKTVAELNTKYESEKKETQIHLQQATIKQKSIYNYLLIVVVVSLIVVSIFIYRMYQQRQKLQHQRIVELETEKQLAATEAVLKGEEQERTRLAKDLHDGLGGMLSGIKHSMQTMKGNLIMTPDNAQAFERSIDMLDSSIKEMRRVAHNMMPEVLVRFGLNKALQDFCDEIDQINVVQLNYQSIGMEAKPDLDQSMSIAIYRIVQELVNNSIKHAKANQVIVQLTLDKNSLSLTVEDDGKGFDTRVLEQAGGIGWENIKSRVAFLKGRIHLQSGGSGTSVLIEFPVA